MFRRVFNYVLASRNTSNTQTIMTVMRKAVKTASVHRDVDMFDPMYNLALQFMFLLISDLSRLCEEIILKRLCQTRWSLKGHQRQCVRVNMMPDFFILRFCLKYSIVLCQTLSLACTYQVLS